jgi:phospho-N-acetylmuramoyl-pentapeptide-transferase
MAPLHHHFEQLGMPETRITVRFLAVAIAGALAGIALAALD